MQYKRLLDASISKESADAWKQRNKKTLGVVCAHVPPEILHAAGILPTRLRATGSDNCNEAEVYMSSFSCSFAKAVLQQLIDEVYDLDGIVTSDGCMQAVRIYDNWKAITKKSGKKQKILEVGAPRMNTATTREYYKQELQILIDELEAFAGEKISEEALINSVELYNKQRRLVQRVMELQKADNPVITGAEALSIMISATNMSVEEHIALLEVFLEDVPNRTPVSGYRARLMIIGSALDDPKYIEAIENKGGLVVADTLCFGSMCFNEECQLDRNDVLGSIANYYLERIICPRMIDNRDALHELILKRAKDYRVDGVIYEKMQNCECWGGETVFLEQELKDIGMPLLNLEREQKLANIGQLEIRAEAFIELIEKEV